MEKNAWNHQPDYIFTNPIHRIFCFGPLLGYSEYSIGIQGYPVTTTIDLNLLSRIINMWVSWLASVLIDLTRTHSLSICQVLLNLWPRVEQRKWILAKKKQKKLKQKQNHQKNKSTGRNRKKTRKKQKKQKKTKKHQKKIKTAENAGFDFVFVFFVFLLFFLVFSLVLVF